MAEVPRNKMDISIEIARLYFQENLTMKEIRDKYYKEMGVRNISRLLKLGRDNWWRLRVVTDPTHSNDTCINRRLSDDVRDNTHFADVVAVDCLGVEEAQNDQQRTLNYAEQEDAFFASDLLHLQISKHASPYLVAKLRHGEYIGIGSGRACTYTAHFASKDPKSGHLKKLKGVKVYALCGGQRDRKWSTKLSDPFIGLPTNLDPDEGASLLADTLGIYSSTSDLCLVNLPVAMHNPDLNDVIATIAPHLNDPAISLSMVVLGLGTLNDRHHFFDQIDGPGLSAIKEDLLLLKKLQKDDHVTLGSIGEVCHRLFWCGETKAPNDIQEIINRINSKIIAVREETLRTVRQTLLIAGGVQKINVLSQLSQGELTDVPIAIETTTLVTDSWTAQELLKRQRI